MEEKILVEVIQVNDFYVNMYGLFLGDKIWVKPLEIIYDDFGEPMFVHEIIGIKDAYIPNTFVKYLQREDGSKIIDHRKRR